MLQCTAVSDWTADGQDVCTAKYRALAEASHQPANAVARIATTYEQHCGQAQKIV